jgi:hypothetical protein
VPLDPNIFLITALLEHKNLVGKMHHIAGLTAIVQHPTDCVLHADQLTVVLEELI